MISRLARPQFKCTEEGLKIKVSQIRTKNIESHRVHAAVLSLSGDTEACLTEHEAFLNAAQSITDIFDQLILKRH